jgi:hypothetical protein
LSLVPASGLGMRAGDGSDGMGGSHRLVAL